MMPRPLRTPDELLDSHRIEIALRLAASGDGGLGFSELRARVRFTDGNLVTHLRRLAAAGVVQARPNGARGRASRTVYALTQDGRQALVRHAAALTELTRRIAAAFADASARASDVTPTLSARVPTDAPPMSWGAPSTPFLDERFVGPD